MRKPILAIASCALLLVCAAPAHAKCVGGGNEHNWAPDGPLKWNACVHPWGIGFQSVSWGINNTSDEKLTVSFVKVYNLKCGQTVRKAGKVELKPHQFQGGGNFSGDLDLNDSFFKESCPGIKGNRVESLAVEEIHIAHEAQRGKQSQPVAAAPARPIAAQAPRAPSPQDGAACDNACSAAQRAVAGPSQQWREEVGRRVNAQVHDCSEQCPQWQDWPEHSNSGWNEWAAANKSCVDGCKQFDELNAAVIKNNAVQEQARQDAIRCQQQCRGQVRAAPQNRPQPAAAPAPAASPQAAARPAPGGRCGATVRFASNYSPCYHLPEFKQMNPTPLCRTLQEEMDEFDYKCRAWLGPRFRCFELSGGTNIQGARPMNDGNAYGRTCVPD